MQPRHTPIVAAAVSLLLSSRVCTPPDVVGTLATVCIGKVVRGEMRDGGAAELCRGPQHPSTTPDLYWTRMQGQARGERPVRRMADFTVANGRAERIRGSVLTIRREPGSMFAGPNRACRRGRNRSFNSTEGAG